MHALARLLLVLTGLLPWAGTLAAAPAERVLPYRDAIERAYNDRDSRAIEAAIAGLKQEDGLSPAERDAATFYAAFGRLRQSALPGIGSERAKEHLEQCIDDLEPLVERHPEHAQEHAQARALHASCLGASASHYLLRAATRGMAARREMAAAVELAPDDPWVVFQDGVSDFLTPAMFGGDPQRALVKLTRAAGLFRASRPAGTSGPVFGESEAWLYIARVHRAGGRPDEARQALEEARKLAPGSADVRDELAGL